MIAVGIVLRIVPWLSAHVFLGQQEYDDAVYYASAKLLLHGQIPYRDFTILHPPGVPLLLLPWAALGAVWGDDVGLALARLAMLAVVTTNMTLIYKIIISGAGARRSSRWGALLGVALYALSPAAVAAEHTVMLEPLVTLFCLSATVLLLHDRAARGSAVGAGLLMMTGLNVKVFAATYLIMMTFLLVVSRRRLLPHFVTGLAIVGCLDVLMIVLAPGQFVRDVVATQLERPVDLTAEGAARVASAFGLGGAPSALALALLTGLFALTTVLVVRSPRQALSFWLGLTVLTGVALTTSRSFFPHYGAFLTAPLSVTWGLALTSVLWNRPLRMIMLAGAATALGFSAAGSVAEIAAHTGQPDPAVISSEVPPGSCLFYQIVSQAIAINRLRAPTRNCPAWIDGRGVLYTQSTHWPTGRPFYDDGFTSNASWQAGLRDQMKHADYLVLSGDPSTIREWSSSTTSYVISNFQEITDVSANGAGRIQLWRRWTQAARTSARAPR